LNEREGDKTQKNFILNGLIVTSKVIKRALEELQIYIKKDKRNPVEVNFR